MKNPEVECDVAIIGGGITGLTAAYRLHELLPGQSIQIFERSQKVGGRLQSSRLSDGASVIDLGAARYCASKHPRLHKLIQEMRIKCVPYSYRLASIQDTLFEHARDKLRSLCLELRNSFDECLENERENVSFWNGACKCIGEVKTTFIVGAAGYDSLRNPKLTFAHGMEILFSHPETQSIRSAESQVWSSPSGGFQSLALALADYLSPTCAIHNSHNLVSIENVGTAAGAVVRLRFDTDHGTRTLLARQVIHTGTLMDFVKVEGCNVSPTVLNHLVGVPLMKGYIEYERAWWRDLDISGHCFTGNSAFRKIYFPKNDPCLIVYADGEGALSIHKLINTYDNVLPQFALAVREALPFSLHHLAAGKVVQQEWKFWANGITFWNAGLNLLPEKFWSYSPNIHHCSDLCTEHIGWIEGGITSAEAIAARLSSILNDPQGATASQEYTLQ